MTPAVTVIGASGFGREALDVLEAMRHAGADLTISGVIDDNPSEVNLDRLRDREISYLGGLENWLGHGVTGRPFVVGIGNPAIRERLAARIEGAGAVPFTAIHPSATIGSRSSFSPGSVVCAGVAISTNVQLGRHVHVNPNATVGHDSILEDYVSLNPGSIISGEVLVGKRTLVGAGATVLQQLNVGPGSLIGAGAVVTKSVPASVVVKGVPGRWDASDG